MRIIALWDMMPCGLADRSRTNVSKEPATSTSRVEHYVTWTGIDQCFPNCAACRPRMTLKNSQASSHQGVQMIGIQN